MTTIDIKHRHTGSVIFTHTAEENSVLITVKQAIEVKADLSGSDLSGSDLSFSNLRFSNLRFSNLRGSNLRGSNLRGSDLSGSDLSGSDLSGSDLSGSDLSGSNLRGSDLRPIKHDLFSVLLYAQHEVPGMLEALKMGKVDGSTYSGDCACLVGTLCKVRGTDARLDTSVIKMPKDSGSAIERWFTGIRPGDTPANSQLVKLTVDWVEEFMSLISHPSHS